MSSFSSMFQSIRPKFFSRSSVTPAPTMLRDLFREDKKDVRIDIQFDDTMPVPFTIDSGTLYTYNKNKNICTSLLFNSFALPDALYLEYYYYGLTPAKKETCAEIDHTAYFNILDFFSSFFKQPIQLKDTSIKLIYDCEFTKNVMFLVKQKTFYERYHFHNVHMHRELKNMLTEKFTDDPQLNELNDQLKTQPTITELEPYRMRIDEKTATLSDVATWLYLLCSSQHPIINTMEFIRFIVKFNIIIQLPNKPEFDDIYTRETSTIPYTFDLTYDNVNNKYMLHIHSPKIPQTRSGGKRKKTIKKGIRKRTTKRSLR